MNKISQYYKLSEIKPDYHKLLLPYNVSSRKKILFNEKELELHYVNEFKIYIADNFTSKPIKGANENVQILFID